MLTILLLLGIAGSELSQDKRNIDKYLKLNVFQATKVDVERIYGEGEFSKNQYFVSYVGGDVLISIDYSMGGCKSDFPLWNLPKWTVTEITYFFRNNPPKLKTLINSGLKYKTRVNGDVLNHVEYFNNSNGISIVFDTNTKQVLHLQIRPTEKQIREFECSGNLSR